MKTRRGSITDRLEHFTASHIKGGMMRVIHLESVAKKNTGLIAFVAMLFVPVLVLAIFA